MIKDSPGSRRFAIALSFPGHEHRPFEYDVATHLAAAFGEERVLYDKFHEVEFSGLDLDVELPTLYRKDSETIALFLFPDYIGKRWCRLEARHIRQLIETPDKKRIMVLRVEEKVDFSEIGVLPGDGYINIDGRSAKEVAEKIIERHRKFNKHAPPELSGSVRVEARDQRAAEGAEERQRIALAEEIESYMEEIWTCIDKTRNLFGSHPSDWRPPERERVEREVSMLDLYRKAKHSRLTREDTCSTVELAQKQMERAMRLIAEVKRLASYDKVTKPKLWYNIPRHSKENSDERCWVSFTHAAIQDELSRISILTKQGERLFAEALKAVELQDSKRLLRNYAHVRDLLKAAVDRGHREAEHLLERISGRK